MKSREAMIRAVEAEARATAGETGRGAFDPRVMAALRKVRRGAFVPEDAAELAYANRPLAIGHGQTISQPFIVALMTDLLELEPTCRVLEVGTGSGYQAAVLAELVEQVWSVEVVGELSRRAGSALAAEGYVNVTLRVGDGGEGWAELAPFDAIMVTAAAAHLPPALVDQLGAPGRMVVPIGAPEGEQVLWLMEKDAAGRVRRHRVLDVAFVPLVGGVDAAGRGHSTDQ